MTLVYLILNLRYFLKEKLNIIIMGATAKGNCLFNIKIAEERLFVATNYFSELINFYPNTKFTLHFVGLELS